MMFNREQQLVLVRPRPAHSRVAAGALTLVIVQAFSSTAAVHQPLTQLASMANLRSPGWRLRGAVVSPADADEHPHGPGRAARALGCRWPGRFPPRVFR